MPKLTLEKRYENYVYNTKQWSFSPPMSFEEWKKDREEKEKELCPYCGLDQSQCNDPDDCTENK
jgi:hypothetical protein